MRTILTHILLAFLLLQGCAPKEPVLLRDVQIVQISPGKDGNPLLKANAIFHNPNKGSMKLTGIDMEILLDGKRAALIDQRMNTSIKGNADFTVPLEVQLQLKEIGLMDTLLSLFGGKKYEVQFVGRLSVRVGGFPVKIPVNHKDQIKF
ncbi:MAG: hypothetical protein SH819_14980 [Cytophagales bacterium]|nr:hypothetical protein [Cytophagales bacterium]